MPIREKKKPNFKKYKRRLKNTSNAVYSVTEFIISGIVKRTTNAKDKDNKLFKRYTTEYGKQKGTHKVTLTDKGTMLHSIDSKKIKNGAKLFFVGGKEQAKAFHNHVTYGRKFFGLDKDQIKHIKKRLGEFLVKTTR